jgi:small subunit ribosomal protein S7
MRKAKPKKRYILPDPKFSDTLVTKFVNYLMKDGKKSIAYSIFYDAVAMVEEKTGENGLESWKKHLIMLCLLLR